ncbi:MAG TPA: phosphodiester glycosidase family protein [Jiangellaceae bacterium]
MDLLASIRRRPIVLAASGAALALASPLLVAPGSAAPAGSEIDLARPGEIVLDRQSTDVAPGLELTTFTRLDPQGWSAGQVLVADLDEPGLSLDYQYSGTVSEPATVREMAESSGAVAAVNGDFYDIDRSFAPNGVGVSRDEGLLTSPVGSHTNAVTVDSDGIARLAQVLLEGTVTVGGEEFELAGVNTHSIPANGIGVFTAAWGEYTRANALGAGNPVAEVTVVDGAVAEVSDTPGEGKIAENELILVGRDAGAEALLGSAGIGAGVDVSYAPRTDFGELTVALGGNQLLVVDGQPRDFGAGTAEPRTAVGLADDGATMFLVVVDGRQPHARGMTLTQLAQFMADLGAEQALNLDGGGSSTMVARTPGTSDHAVINSPSDGTERRVANGLGLFAAAGSGRLAGLSVTAASDRVFPGLTRTLTAHGHDETFAPVDSDPLWRAFDPRVASVKADEDGEAIVTGKAPGTTDVIAQDRAAWGEAEVTVLGELQRIVPSTGLLVLPDIETVAPIELMGYDIDGFRAPLEARDLEISGDEQLEIGEQDGTLTVRGLEDATSAELTITAAGVETQVAIAVGLEDVTVADFSDAEDWTIAFARATGSIEAIEGPDGRPGVRMSYDFVTQAGNTRAAYATPPAQFELPGQPQEITAWVEGDGNGTWIRMRVYDRNGTLVTLNGGYTTFTGWQQLTFPVPDGTEYPLTFRDIYAVQVGDVAYHGTTGFSEIQVRVAPEVAVPEREAFADPVVLQGATTDGSPLRIAVANDAQFVGSDPDSDLVAAARRTLREIVAAGPDVLIINGDFVDEASTVDFALARQILDEELGGVEFPWYYVPGNHEVQGGPLQNFIDEFGATQHTFDVDGTRIITLNSAFGTFRAGGDLFDQILELRRALDDAAEDPDVSGVLVFAHHPPNDPLPAKNSQLVDRREATMIEQWLSRFVAESGKSAAYVGGHVGAFHAESIDGVPYLITGNMGKDPATTPDNGGFTGWTMLGVDPAAGSDVRRPGRPSSRPPWLRAEIKPRVDAISLSAPAALVMGETADVAATVSQDDGRTVPVSWPVSAVWGGDGVHVGAASEAPGDAVVALDPDAGTVTALRAGIAEVSVTVNGESATAEVVVAP